MSKPKTKQEWRQWLSTLSIDDRVRMYWDYCMDYGYPSEAIHDLGEDFFETWFDSHFECFRATFFGDVQSFYDPYIRFNAYGNLESLTESRAIEIVENYLDDIYEHPDIWEQYING